MTRVANRLRPAVPSLLLLAAACHQDGSGQVGPPVPLPPRIPTADQAQDVGDRIDEHTQDLLIAFNVSELLIFELPVRALVREEGILRAGGCPTVDDGTDTDGDGVPDNATFTFDEVACTEFVDTIGTFTRSGAVAIEDIDTGYRLAWEDYRVELEALGGDVSAVTMNGTWDVTVTGTSATLVESVVMTTEEETAEGTTTGTFEYDWIAQFESDGDPIVLASSLPSGTLSVQGPTVWTLDDVSFSFDASTLEAIEYAPPPDCDLGLEFLSGGVRALQQNGMGTFVDVRYEGCGLEPEIIYSPAY
jgi:hypothetical protein